MDILTELLVEILLSIGIVAFSIDKIKSKLFMAKNNINKIKDKGITSKKMKQTIISSNEVNLFVISGTTFININRELLIDKINDGMNIKVLLSSKNTDFIKEAALMEGRQENAISDLIDNSIDEIKSIVSKAKENATGKIEVRLFNTELRNPMTICIDKENNILAWVSLLIPPKKAIDSLQIELYGERASDCKVSFDLVWNRSKFAYKNWTA